MSKLVSGNNVIDFTEFKNSGSLCYVEDSVVDDPSDRLDEISFVMEMSTDELISEMACRLEYGRSLRDVSDTILVDELQQRFAAMRFLMVAYTHLKLKDGPKNES